MRKDAWSEYTRLNCVRTVAVRTNSGSPGTDGWSRKVDLETSLLLDTKSSGGIGAPKNAGIKKLREVLKFPILELELLNQVEQVWVNYMNSLNLAYLKSAIGEFAGDKTESEVRRREFWVLSIKLSLSSPEFYRVFLEGIRQLCKQTDRRKYLCEDFYVCVIGNGLVYGKYKTVMEVHESIFAYEQPSHDGVLKLVEVGIACGNLEVLMTIARQFKHVGLYEQFVKNIFKQRLSTKVEQIRITENTTVDIVRTEEVSRYLMKFSLVLLSCGHVPGSGTVLIPVLEYIKEISLIQPEVRELCWMNLRQLFEGQNMVKIYGDQAKADNRVNRYKKWYSKEVVNSLTRAVFSLDRGVEGIELIINGIPSGFVVKNYLFWNEMYYNCYMSSERLVTFDELDKLFDRYSREDSKTALERNKNYHKLTEYKLHFFYKTGRKLEFDQLMTRVMSHVLEKDNLTQLLRKIKHQEVYLSPRILGMFVRSTCRDGHHREALQMVKQLILQFDYICSSKLSPAAKKNINKYVSELVCNWCIGIRNFPEANMIEIVGALDASANFHLENFWQISNHIAYHLLLRKQYLETKQLFDYLLKNSSTSKQTLSAVIKSLFLNSRQELLQRHLVDSYEDIINEVVRALDHVPASIIDEDLWRKVIYSYGNFLKSFDQVESFVLWTTNKVRYNTAFPSTVPATHDTATAACDGESRAETQDSARCVKILQAIFNGKIILNLIKLGMEKCPQEPYVGFLLVLKLQALGFVNRKILDDHELAIKRLIVSVLKKIYVVGEEELETKWVAVRQKKLQQDQVHRQQEVNLESSIDIFKSIGDKIFASDLL